MGRRIYVGASFWTMAAPVDLHAQIYARIAFLQEKLTAQNGHLFPSPDPPSPEWLDAEVEITWPAAWALANAYAQGQDDAAAVAGATTKAAPLFTGQAVPKKLLKPMVSVGRWCSVGQ